MKSGGDIKLTAKIDVTGNENLEIGKNTTIDLAGFELNLDDKKIIVSNGNTFTLDDSTKNATTGISENGKITSSSETLVQVGTYAKGYSGTKAKFVMNGGKLTSTATPSSDDDTKSIVKVGASATSKEGTDTKFRSYYYDTTAAEFEMNNGTITNDESNTTTNTKAGSGININGKSTVDINGGSIISKGAACVYFGDKDTEGGGTLNMTGGTLEGKGSRSTIGTNGTMAGDTKINISGGTVVYNNSNGSKPAIYASAVGELNISGQAKIFSSTVGIEIRKGTLNVTGGTIKEGTVSKDASTGEFSVSDTSTADGINYSYSSSGSSCKKGAAIVVSQHTTQKNINVNISSGVISGYVALAVINANGNKTVGTSDDIEPESDANRNSDGSRKEYVTGGFDGGMRVGELIANPDTSLEYPKDYVNYVIGDIDVNVTGGTLKSTADEDAETSLKIDDYGSGRTEEKYKLTGKIAVLSADTRIKVNLSGTNVEGSALAITTGRAADDTGFGVGENNTFSGFDETSSSAGSLLTYNSIRAKGKAKNATKYTDADLYVSTLGKGEAFNRPDKDATEWKYLTSSGSTVASIGSAAEDSNTLMLTVPGGTASLSSAAEIDFTSNLFSKYNNATKFDGSAAPASFPLNIKGNDKITKIIGGAGNDSIKPAGEVDSVTLTGGDGNDLFFFDGNSNTITDFGTGDDSVTLANSKFRPANADFLATKEKEDSNGKITIDFGGGDALMFENLGDKTEVSLTGGHVFATRYHAFDKQIALTSVQSAAFFDASEAKFANYATIDAASASAISIMGNSLDNRIIGSNQGGTLNGGDKNDRLIVTDRNSSAKYQFEHTAGKDSIEGFDDTNDTLAITPADITEAKGSGSKLTLTFGKDNDNSVVLKSDVDIEKVSLNASGDYLTSSGYRTTNGETKEFKLFANAKGKIDLTDTPYKGTGITAIDASAAEKQSVTLTADSNVTTVKLAENNKKKDLFVYGGGAVSISGYEAGTDKLNIADVGAVSLFTVDSTGVSINAGGKGIISIQGALTNQEVLIRDGGKSNSYQKFVFAKTGVLYNKAKKPTEATIYQNVDNKEAFKAEDSVKKIFLQAGVSGASIQSGNNKATLDASEANGVSLIGGAKNNKFIGSAGDDLFVYKGGKDNIQGFDAKDKITLDGDFSLSSAKISASSKSLKFKFTNKNVLTLKSDGKITSASINGGNYSFSKNAVGLNGVVSLTNAFSGSYNLAKSTAIGNTVDGSAVKKNLTFKGTDAAESLSGGQKKTTFKGGGGADIFVGNSTGKDVFFYAKTDSGNKTIKDFGFGSNNDKIKIASGTIKTISKSSDAITFSTNGGSLKVTELEGKDILLKANNTYYWFAESADSEHGVSVGDLITADTKVSNAQAVATGYDVIDLGYSTNLVKTNLATKAGSFTFSQGSITKNNTTT